MLLKAKGALVSINPNKNDTVRKVSKYGIFFWSIFPIFRLNTEIYGVHLRTQSIYGKKTNQKKLRIWTLFTSVDVFKVVFSVEGDSI